jgi:L-lysine exporter family protein LysE/ArgO
MELTQLALQTLLKGFAASAVLIIAIGAQNAFILRQGILREHIGIIMIICILSDALLITLGVAGLGALVQQSTVLLMAAQYGGALFLLYYGGAAWVRSNKINQLDAGAPTTRMSAKTAVFTTLALTFLNPHVYLDTVVLLGAISTKEPPAYRVWFTVGAVLASTVWFAGLGLGARWLAPLFATPKAWRYLDRAVAITMWCLAIGLLLG